MERIVGMENSYSWNSQTPRVSGREIIRDNTIWYSKILKSTPPNAESGAAKYPSDRDCLVSKRPFIPGQACHREPSRTQPPQHQPSAKAIKSAASRWKHLRHPEVHHTWQRQLS